MKVIIIEQGKAPYFKDIDLEKYNDNMNTYAEAEIDCDYIDRVQILPNYELTIYVDDLNSRRDDSELNFFVKGVQYDLPVKGKAVVSRGEVYLDEIEYQDTTERDLEILNEMIIRPGKVDLKNNNQTYFDNDFDNALKESLGEELIVEDPATFFHQMGFDKLSKKQCLKKMDKVLQFVKNFSQADDVMSISTKTLADWNDTLLLYMVTHFCQRFGFDELPEKFAKWE